MRRPKQRLLDAIDTVPTEDDFAWDDGVDAFFGRERLDEASQTLGVRHE